LLIDGKEVGRIALGGAAWSIFDDGDDDEAIRTIRAALDAGVRLIDTARAYSRSDFDGHNEDLIRRALAKHAARHDVVVATKGGHFRAGDAFPIDGRPASLRRDVERSLRTLQTESIGLYFLHKPDPNVPIEESVGALAEFKAEGLIGNVGLSNVDGALLRRARTITNIAAIENPMSLARGIDRLALNSELPFLAYSPFAGLADLRPESAAVLRAMASDHNASIQRVVLSWVLAQSTTIVAIVGSRHPATIRDSVAPVTLSPEELATVARLAGHSDEKRSPRIT